MITPKTHQEFPDTEGTFLVAIVTMVIIPFSLTWSGYTLSILWKWFMVPLSAPALNVPQAIGVIIIVNSLIRKKSLKKDDRPIAEQIRTSIAMSAFGPALSLLAGWIVTFFL